MVLKKKPVEKQSENQASKGADKTVKKQMNVQEEAVKKTTEKKEIRARPAANKVTAKETRSHTVKPKAEKGRVLTAEGWKRVLTKKKKEEKQKSKG